jgi:alpha-tubulin suppressor-like RCC1 family protein
MLRHSLRRVAALRRRRALAHLASKGPGFLGCLGHGDWKDCNELEAIRDDNDNFVRVKSIGAGWAHSAAVLEDGVCVVWGRYLEPPESALRLSHIERVVPPLARLVNATASLLDRDDSLRLRPTPITDQCLKVACGAGVTALIRTNGSLETLGANQFGQCGIGDHSDVVREPAPVKWDSTQVPISKVVLGFRHGLCLAENGQVYSWGKNDAGQLGDGSRTSRPAVAPVKLDEACIAIGAGLNHSAALTTDGRLFVWGKMRDASSKKPSTVSRDLPDVYGDALVPRPVPGHRYKDVACSSFHCVVLDEDGQVYCMGLERGSRKMVHAPRQVRLPPGVRVLSIRNGVDAVALLCDDGRTYVPDLSPGLSCGCEVREEVSLDDVVFGWRHAVAIAA